MSPPSSTDQSHSLGLYRPFGRVHRRASFSPANAKNEIRKMTDCARHVASSEDSNSTARGPRRRRRVKSVYSRRLVQTHNADLSPGCHHHQNISPRRHFVCERGRTLTTRIVKTIHPVGECTCLVTHPHGPASILAAQCPPRNPWAKGGTFKRPPTRKNVSHHTHARHQSQRDGPQKGSGNALCSPSAHCVGGQALVRTNKDFFVDTTSCPIVCAPLGRV